MLFPRWGPSPCPSPSSSSWFSCFCRGSPSVSPFWLRSSVVLLAFFVFLPSLSSALYIVRMDYIPVELIDEFSDGKGTLSREKRRIESQQTAAEDDDRLASAEMDSLEREYKTKLRQLAEEEDDRIDREELAQRWESLRRNIEDNVRRVDAHLTDRQEDNGRWKQNDDDQWMEQEGREQQEGDIVLALPAGVDNVDDDGSTAEMEPLAVLFEGNEQPPGLRRDSARGEVLLLEV